MSRIQIIIPARYHSTRLPGKPLVKIAGTEMILRVARIAEYVCRHNPDCKYAVATDDQRIEQFCKEHGVEVVMTSNKPENGTQRCIEAILNLGAEPELIINLQGDNPLCPPWIIQDLVDSWQREEAEVYTPCVTLEWAEYDAMVETKRTTPHSGTCVVTDKNGFAMSFSKNIIPSIRRPEKARKQMDKSPVKRHIGLYAYTYPTLMSYFELDQSPYESGDVEGLEQIRFLYNRLRVKSVEVSYRGRETTSGVDAPEDIKRVEEIIERYGEFDLTR